MDLMILSPIGAAVALIYAYYLANKVTKQPEGTDQMAKISASIRLGADAYLKREYTSVVKFFLLVFVVLLALSVAGFMDIFIPISFLTGGFFSGLAGFFGMKIATAANARTAWAAKKSLNDGLRLAFLGRLGHGLCGCRPGPAGRFSLVLFPAVLVPRPA